MMKRTAVKNQQWMKDPVARRQAVLQQQRQARRDLALHARQLLVEDSSSGNEEGKKSRRRNRGVANEVDDMEVSSTYSNGSSDAQSKRKSREERVKHRREHYAKQLMVPEWMIDIPRDLNGKGSELGAGWYVLPRPEGKRCLVVANGCVLLSPFVGSSCCAVCTRLTHSRTHLLFCCCCRSGHTIARIPSGSILKKFPSALPSGSHKTNISTESYCILDCIFHEHDSTFYVLDVMCWKVVRNWCFSRAHLLVRMVAQLEPHVCVRVHVGILAVQLHDGIPTVLAARQAIGRQRLDDFIGKPVSIHGASICAACLPFLLRGSASNVLFALLFLPLDSRFRAMKATSMGS